MKKSLKMTALISVGVSLALVATACTGGSGTTSTEGTEGSTTLTASHPQEPTSWNYMEDASSAFMVPIYLNVLESLFETAEDGALKPLLATGYEASDDALTYTIKLREATFHDGSAFDSADVVYSLNKNATALNGVISAPLRVVSKVEAPDASTVVVTLSRPSNSFIAGLGTPATMMSPEGYFETADVGKKIIGTGPFSFGEYRADVDLTLNGYEDYWGEKPFMKKVIHQFMADETATINAMRAGELDIVGMLFGPGVEQVASFEGDDRYTVSFAPSTSGSYLFLNPKTKALQDIRVRQAIAYAIDRKPIIDAAVGGYAEPSCVYVPTWTSSWNSDYCPYPFDQDKAKQLLAEAGYADGLTIDFPYLTIAEFPASFEVVNSQLAAVGITVDGRGQDLPTWAAQVFSKIADYEISHITNNASLSSYSCEGATPPFGSEALCDPDFEAFVTNNDQIVDPGEYTAAMKAMADHVADTGWMIELFAKTEPGIAKAGLTGLAKYRTAIEMDYRHIRWAK